MRRSAGLKQKKPMAPGKGFAARSKPMPRGTSTLTSKQPMQRASKPMAAVGQRAKRTGQGKVPPTAAERAWMDRIAAAGCIVCWLHFQTKTAAEVHHLKHGDRRMGHLFSIGLCTAHHRGGEKEGQFISRHPWKRRFEAAYGPELELLDASRTLLAWDEDSPSSVIVAP